MYRDVVEELILRRYSPPGVLINEKNEMLYIHGRTGKYLEPASGEFSESNNIVGMAREGLKLELATSIRKASIQKIEVRSNNVLLKTNGGNQLINLVVKPLSQPASLKGTIMVFFEDMPLDNQSEFDVNPPQAVDTAVHPRILQLEHDLSSTKEYLQTTIEELETSNEELKSTNEELQSSNEELQSTNEELETSKEELQSVNEELSTVNSEHQQKIEELSKTTNDLNNLLASTEIGTIFLDMNLRIRRFTPASTRILNLIQSDIGRPITHLASNIEYEGLVDDVGKVLKTLVPKDTEVRSREGFWYSMRVMPYRTSQNTIEGVVITFMEITGLKATQNRLESSRDELEGVVENRTEELGSSRQSEQWLRSIFNVIQDAVIVTTPEGIIGQVNPAAEKMFGYSEQEMVRRTTEIIHLDHKHYLDFGEKLKNIFQQGETGEIEYEVKNRNGEIFHVIGAVHLLGDDHGKVLGRMFSMTRPLPHGTAAANQSGSTID